VREKADKYKSADLAQLPQASGVHELVVGGVSVGFREKKKGILPHQVWRGKGKKVSYHLPDSLEKKERRQLSFHFQKEKVKKSTRGIETGEEKGSEREGRDSASGPPALRVLKKNISKCGYGRTGGKGERNFLTLERRTQAQPRRRKLRRNGGRPMV